MTIGILTMYRVLNYGSFLQAFSLKYQLEARGAEVFFLDIDTGKQICIEPRKRIIIDRIKAYANLYCINAIQNRNYTKNINRIHQQDIDKFLLTTCNNDEHFDCVVIGSDEVFSCCTPTHWGFSRQLLGDIHNAELIVSYAASCGETTYDQCVKYNVIDETRECLQHIRMISVRDDNTSRFIERLVGLKPYVHIDPVFLTDFSEMIPDIESRPPYLIIYSYANRINDSDEIRSIKKYARKHKLEIMCVGQPQLWCKNNLNANAFEVLAYFRQAHAIITDTFHGTVFSIISNKQFGVFVRDSNYNKLMDLLKRFGLESQQINEQPLDVVLDKKINYTRVNNLCRKYKEESYRYLDKVIDLCKEQK